MLAFDPTTRLTVEEALAHPWLSAYHDVNDEPSCPRVFDRWREVEELQSIDDFRTALWNEVEDYRREVRAIALELDEDPAPLRSPSIRESISHSPTYGRGTPLPPSSHLPPAASDACAQHISQPLADGARANAVAVAGYVDNSVINFPSYEPSPEKPLADGEPGAMPRARHMRFNSHADPLVSYARRASMLSVSEYPGNTPDERESAAAYPFPSVHSREGYVLPARSRTASMAGPVEMSRRLLRTLSTVSIHEPVDVAAIAAAAGAGRAQEGVPDMARFIRGRPTAADGPPSTMPGEIAESESGGSGGGKDGSGGDDRVKG
jgi:serine/threonine protein kinase